MLFDSVALVALGVVAVLLFLVLFEPPLRYDVAPPSLSLDSEQFLCLLGALADAQVYRQTTVEVLSGGEAFYQAELDAIRGAVQSVHIEAFLFTPGPITDRFLEALTDRARAGARVRLVLDAIGCFHTPNRYFRELCAAGGEVYWYQPIRWYTLKRVNNRTHRELIIIDGKLGFIGGAGIAPHWLGGEKGERPWHDLMCRVRGPLVEGLQTAFAENWLESSNQILAGAENFPRCVQGDEFSGPDAAGPVKGMVVISTPTAARSTRARVVFQVLLASARKSILINSPYFLPDRSARKELIAAVRRGVKVSIISPGRANNHPITRVTSRRLYGQLLRAGIEIYEYQPGMIHKKALVVDGVWVVVGSTNFDARSFGLNDEVNLAAIDPELAARLERDFGAEKSQSRQITYGEWRRRPILERLLSLPGLLIQRQT